MKSIKSVVCLFVAVGLAWLGFVGVWTLSKPATTRAEESSFTVDPVHSALVFRIRYSGISSFWGRFNELSGSVVFDPDKPQSMKVDLKVNSASVDTGNDRRDGHLKSPDFLSAKQFGEILFQSTSVKSTGDGEFDVTGDLTLRGVSKSVVAKVTYGGKTETREGGLRIGFDGSLTFQRKDFGITYGEGVLGGVVEIRMGLTAVRR